MRIAITFLIAILISACTTLEISDGLSLYNDCTIASNEAEALRVSMRQNPQDTEFDFNAIKNLERDAEVYCTEAIAKLDTVSRRGAGMTKDVAGTAMAVIAFATDTLSDIRSISSGEGRRSAEAGEPLDVPLISETRARARAAIQAHNADQVFIGAENLARLSALPGRVDFRIARAMGASGDDAEAIRPMICSGLANLRANDGAQHSWMLSALFAEDRLRGLQPLFSATGADALAERERTDMAQGDTNNETVSTQRNANQQIKDQIKNEACSYFESAENAFNALGGDEDDAYAGANFNRILQTLRTLGANPLEFNDKQTVSQTCEKYWAKPAPTLALCSGLVLPTTEVVSIWPSQ